MNFMTGYFVTILCFLSLQVESTKILQRFFKSASTCENYCDVTYKKENLKSSCEKGCRLLTIIGLAKDLQSDSNKTENLCFSSCEEAYTNAPEAKACNDGCKKEASSVPEKDNEAQTLHLLTPLMYVKSAYKTVAHHVKQLVTTSFTLYVEEDTGKMVVLQTNPKTVIQLSDGKESKNSASTNSMASERSDWMDCISQQSGLPRWILVSVLFGFIVTLLWLCCVTTVTAPNHHISSRTKKLSPKNDIAYLYLYEPVDEVKIQPPADEQAPPLPVKVNFA